MNIDDAVPVEKEGAVFYIHSLVFKIVQAGHGSL
jgi:hypothetical protein